MTTAMATPFWTRSSRTSISDGDGDSLLDKIFKNFNHFSKHHFPDGPAGGRQGDQSVRCNTIQSSFPHPRLPAPAPLPTGNLSPNVIAQRDLSRL